MNQRQEPTPPLRGTPPRRGLFRPKRGGNGWIVGQLLKKSLYFHPPQVPPTAVALVTLEEQAYPVCIERAVPLLDPPFFEYRKVPRGPPWIGVEGGYPSAPYGLVIIHIQRRVYPTAGSDASLFFQLFFEKYVVALHAPRSYNLGDRCWLLSVGIVSR